MTMSFRIRILALSACLLAACGSSGSESPAGAPSLTPDTPPGGETSSPSAIYVKGRADGDKLAIDVYARGAADVHGVALRMTYAPTVLQLADATPAPVWAAGSVVLAKEGVPGEAAITWATKGQTPGFAAQNETLLGTVRFTLKSRAETTLAFRAERSRVIDSKGAVVQLDYLGGKIAAR